MHSLDVLTQFITVLNANPFAAVVLIALVAVTWRRPPKD